MEKKMKIVDEKPKVSKLSDYSNNTMSVSPEQAIECLQEFLKENPGFDKVLLIAIDNKKGKFLYDWWKGRTLCSEAITVLHLVLDDQTRALKGEEV